MMLLVLLLQVITPMALPAQLTCEFDQPAATIEEARSYSYRYHLDGSQLGSIFPSVTCTGPTPGVENSWTCKSPLNVTIPGQHTIYIVTALSNEFKDGETSTPSPMTTFTVGSDAPGQPNSVVIIK